MKTKCECTIQATFHPRFKIWERLFADSFSFVISEADFLRNKDKKGHELCCIPPQKSICHAIRWFCWCLFKACNFIHVSFFYVPSFRELAEEVDITHVCTCHIKLQPAVGEWISRTLEHSSRCPTVKTQRKPRCWQESGQKVNFLWSYPWSRRQDEVVLSASESWKSPVWLLEGCRCIVDVSCFAYEHISGNDISVEARHPAVSFFNPQRDRRSPVLPRGGRWRFS